MQEFAGKISWALVIDTIANMAPYIVAIISVCGVIYTAIKGHDTQLTSAYFTKKAESYERFWECLTAFVYAPDDQTRNALVVSVYNAAMYSSGETQNGIQAVYNKAIDNSQAGLSQTQVLDLYASELEKLFQKDLVRFRSRKRR